MYTRICPINNIMTIAGSEIILPSVPEPLTQTFLTKEVSFCWRKFSNSGKQTKFESAHMPANLQQP
jgi:hypothetical protein